ncbi:MAG: DUF58 domain-containing protein, partial [Actinomycetia bacterium]|nr:DUF58 domain-containing protein [Actinomycetes bacterium]
GIGGVVVAVALGRSDLVVLTGPLLAIAAWSAWLRPVERPAYEHRWATLAVREGETTSCTVRLDPHAGIESAHVVVTTPSFVEVEPEGGAAAMTRVDDRFTVTMPVRSTRWGRRVVGPLAVTASSAWDGFRARSSAFGQGELVTSPIPSTFDTSAPIPHPVGLVGQHRSRRRGEGSEFNSIRPFQVGDRLRRLHWPVSLRTGELHSISTWADQDAHVVLLVDGTDDLGPSDGVDGEVSALDATVRAAAAVAEQYLRGGDRVETRVMDARGVRRVPPSSGTTQLRRVLDQLATIRPGAGARFDPLRNQRSLAHGATVVMLSSLIAPSALAAAASLARSGFSIVVIDTLPKHVEPHQYDDRYGDLAWRIRLLERQREVHRIEQLGVPVVPWRGPGSLDQVLRDLTRRASAPRLARR